MSASPPSDRPEETSKPSPSSGLWPLGAARHAPPPNASRPSWMFFLVLSCIAFVLDIASKAWAEAAFSPTAQYAGPIRRVFATDIGSYKVGMNFMLARNKGGAWSLFANMSEDYRKAFFLGISVLAILFIVSTYASIRKPRRALSWGLPLVFGGALGNVLDRIRYGSVVDFVDTYIVIGGVSKNWPTFNVADVWIVVGVGLMVVDMFTGGREPRYYWAPKAPPAQSGEPSHVPTNPERGDTPASSTVGS